jgi:hypothetical protein
VGAAGRKRRRRHFAGLQNDTARQRGEYALSEQGRDNNRVEDSFMPRQFEKNNEERSAQPILDGEAVVPLLNCEQMA